MEMRLAPLLERKRRGVQLTSAGRVLLHTRGSSRSSWSKSRRAGQFRQRPEGTCRLLSTSARWESLPAPWRPFSLSIRISTSTSTTTEAAKLSEISPRGAAISALSGRPLIQPQAGEFSVRSIRLDLVTPLRHPLSRSRKIAFREALNREFVGFAAGNPMQVLLNYHPSAPVAGSSRASASTLPT